MSTPPKHIALLGGSFDPPHLAHVQVIEHLLRSGDYDEVWVLPSGPHPFKTSSAPFSDRMEMCRLAFEPLGGQVKILEEDERSSGYTIDLIRHLKKSHPGARFTFALGSDLKSELPRWKDAEALQTLLDFEFLPRPPEPGSPFLDVSSTRVRERVKNHLPIGDFVPKAVEEYIQKKNLYQ